MIDHKSLFAQHTQPWVVDGVAFLTLHGSKCYGTDLPTSDTDYRGVVIPPKEYFLSQRKSFDEYSQLEPNDLKVFDVRKFIKLALQNNPNVLEIFFTDPSDHIHVSKSFNIFLEHKDKFLSKKIKDTFCGYSFGELKKMKKHRSWLLNPPKSPPTRKEHDLPEATTLIPKNQMEAMNAAIKKQMDSWNWHNMEFIETSVRQEIKDSFEKVLLEVNQWHWDEIDHKMWFSASKQIGLDDNVIEILKREKAYNSKMQEWKQFLQWQTNRNPERFKLEEKCGYDSKNASQLIRLLRTSKEALETGKMNIKRTYIDADEIRNIRLGSWTYGHVIEYAENMNKEIDDVVKSGKCVLPDKPDEEYIDKLLSNVIHNVIVAK